MKFANTPTGEILLASSLGSTHNLRFFVRSLTDLLGNWRFLGEIYLGGSRQYLGD